MLILTRRISESIIHIHPDGTKTTMTVLGVKGNQVRIGIQAPRNVVVHREEIMHRILDENEGKIPGTGYDEDGEANKVLNYSE